jgi:CheY-like chemotaxis protein
MRIVVVDDEPALLDVMTELLEDEGHDVLSFAHPGPVEELKNAEEQPDLFLVDVMLPDMNGITLAARLKDDGFASTPKIAMSASPQMLRAAQESNLFHATLEKPFDLETLLSSIQRSRAA